MEFRCRLASPNGEIVEGVYIADSEARLRHELEEKGLFVLSLQPKGAIAGVSLQLPQRRGINTREFLVFNQELATLRNATTYNWIHPLGDIISSLLAAGLTLDWFHEHDAVTWRMFKILAQDAEGLWRWPDQPWLPLAFSLRAARR